MKISRDIKRIVAFGCSLTYGHGLPDCHIPPDQPGNSPSKHAWPAVVADRLTAEVDNQSRCGSGNLEILYKLLSYKFQPGDIAVIMWSFTNRDLIFGNKNLFGQQTVTALGTWQDTDLANHWMLTHTHGDIATRSWLYMHHAVSYLTLKNIPVYNIPAHYNGLKYYKPKFLDVKVHRIKTNMSSPTYLALDNLHPGIKTHSAVADEIVEILKNER
jgi:hypothetical protein